MNCDERRRQKRTSPKPGADDAARRQAVTRPSSDGAEESKPDPDRDEGGES